MPTSVPHTNGAVNTRNQIADSLPRSACDFRLHRPRRQLCSQPHAECVAHRQSNVAVAGEESNRIYSGKSFAADDADCGTSTYDPLAAVVTAIAISANRDCSSGKTIGRQFDNRQCTAGQVLLIAKVLVRRDEHVEVPFQSRQEFSVGHPGMAELLNRRDLMARAENGSHRARKILIQHDAHRSRPALAAENSPASFRSTDGNIVEKLIERVSRRRDNPTTTAPATRVPRNTSVPPMTSGLEWTGLRLSCTMPHRPWPIVKLAMSSIPRGSRSDKPEFGSHRPVAQYV